VVSCNKSTGSGFPYLIYGNRWIPGRDKKFLFKGLGGRRSKCFVIGVINVDSGGIVLTLKTNLKRVLFMPDAFLILMMQCIGI
jgi:hypothetical protein